MESYRDLLRMLETETPKERALILPTPPEDVSTEVESSANPLTDEKTSCEEKVLLREFEQLVSSVSALSPRKHY